MPPISWHAPHFLLPSFFFSCSPSFTVKLFSRLVYSHPLLLVSSHSLHHADFCPSPFIQSALVIVTNGSLLLELTVFSQFLSYSMVSIIYILAHFLPGNLLLLASRAPPSPGGSTGSLPHLCFFLIPKCWCVPGLCSWSVSLAHLHSFPW